MESSTKKFTAAVYRGYWAYTRLKQIPVDIPAAKNDSPDWISTYTDMFEMINTTIFKNKVKTILLEKRLDDIKTEFNEKWAKIPKAAKESPARKAHTRALFEEEYNKARVAEIQTSLCEWLGADRTVHISSSDASLQAIEYAVLYFLIAVSKKWDPSAIADLTKYETCGPFISADTAAGSAGAPRTTDHSNGGGESSLFGKRAATGGRTIDRTTSGGQPIDRADAAGPAGVPRGKKRIIKRNQIESESEGEDQGEDEPPVNRYNHFADAAERWKEYKLRETMSQEQHSESGRKLGRTEAQIRIDFKQGAHAPGVRSVGATVCTKINKTPEEPHLGVITNITEDGILVSMCDRRGTIMYTPDSFTDTFDILLMPKTPRTRAQDQIEQIIGLSGSERPRRPDEEIDQNLQSNAEQVQALKEAIEIKPGLWYRANRADAATGADSPGTKDHSKEERERTIHTTSDGTVYVHRHADEWYTGEWAIADEEEQPIEFLTVPNYTMTNRQWVTALGDGTCLFKVTGKDQIIDQKTRAMEIVQRLLATNAHNITLMDGHGRMVYLIMAMLAAVGQNVDMYHFTIYETDKATHDWHDVFMPQNVTKINETIMPFVFRTNLGFCSTDSTLTREWDETFPVGVVYFNFCGLDDSLTSAHAQSVAAKYTNDKPATYLASLATELVHSGRSVFISFAMRNLQPARTDSLSLNFKLSFVKLNANFPHRRHNQRIRMTASQRTARDVEAPRQITHNEKTECYDGVSHIHATSTELVSARKHLYSTFELFPCMTTKQLELAHLNRLLRHNDYATTPENITTLLPGQLPQRRFPEFKPIYSDDPPVITAIVNALTTPKKKVTPSQQTKRQRAAATTAEAQHRQKLFNDLQAKRKAAKQSSPPSASFTDMCMLFPQLRL